MFLVCEDGTVSNNDGSCVDVDECATGAHSCDDTSS